MHAQVMMASEQRPLEARRAGAPALSVVVAWSGGAARLERCLGGLYEEVAACGGELVVAYAGTAADVAARHPAVRLVWCPAQSTTAELRAAGMRAASGDIVALTDGAVPVGGWLAHLMDRNRPVGQG